MIVREYEPRDLEACRRLFDELVEVHRQMYPEGEIGSTFELSDQTFVADDDGNVIGYAGLLWHGRRRAELEPIVIARDHQGRGVGRELVERVVEEARAGGAVRIFVRPVARNSDAIAFFHTAGFDVIGYLELQIDFEPRERKRGHTIAGLQFRI